MAHVVVYLQRSPKGLHPASASGLCLARDLADERGATVTAVVNGDAAGFDESVAAQAGKCGADQLFFVGPTRFAKLCDRLRPKSVVLPWTPEGAALAGATQLPEAQLCWTQEPPEGGLDLPAVVAVLAGSLPWQHAPVIPESEYGADVAEAKLPGWLKAGSDARELTLGFVDDPGIDATTRAALASVGAQSLTVEQACSTEHSVTLWSTATSNALPAQLRDRPTSARAILLTGATPQLHESWIAVDWALAGPPADIVRELQGQPWRDALC